MESEGRTASIDGLSQEILIKEDSRSQTQCLYNASKIFVGGLPADLTREEFKAYFEKFGSIEDVVVMSDKETNRPRKFGFVTFDSPETANNVLKNRFYELKNKRVEVKKAVSKERMITRNFGNYYNAMYNGYGNTFPYYGNFGSYCYRPMSNYGYGVYNGPFVASCEGLSYAYYPYNNTYPYQSTYYHYHADTYSYQSPYYGNFSTPTHFQRYRNRTPVVIKKSSHVNNGVDHSDVVRKNVKLGSEVNDEESVVKGVLENGEISEGLSISCGGDGGCVEAIQALSLCSDGSGEHVGDGQSSSCTIDS